MDRPEANPKLLTVEQRVENRSWHAQRRERERFMTKLTVTQKDKTTVGTGFPPFVGFNLIAAVGQEVWAQLFVNSLPFGICHELQ